MKKKRHRIGLKVIETATITLAIVVTLLVTVKMLIAGIDLFDMAKQRRDASLAGQRALQAMVQEILMLNPSAISSYSETSMAWKGVAETPIDYALRVEEGAVTLVRNDEAIAKNVVFLDFDYKTISGMPTHDPKRIQRINIDFVIAALKRSGSVRFRTEIFPRHSMYKEFALEVAEVGDVPSFLRALYAAQAGIEYALRQSREGKELHGQREFATSHFEVMLDRTSQRLKSWGNDGGSSVLVSISFSPP